MKSLLYTRGNTPVVQTRKVVRLHCKQMISRIALTIEQSVATFQSIKPFFHHTNDRKILSNVVENVLIREWNSTNLIHALYTRETREKCNVVFEWKIRARIEASFAWHRTFSFLVREWIIIDGKMERFDRNEWNRHIIRNDLKASLQLLGLLRDGLYNRVDTYVDSTRASRVRLHKHDECFN